MGRRLAIEDEEVKQGKAPVPVKPGRTTFSCVRGNGDIWTAP